MSNDAFRAKATATGGLEGRAGANQRFGDADFDGWIHDWLDPLPASSVLDLCCGTGNQLVLYGARPESRRIVGVDLSTESLEKARGRLTEMETTAAFELHGFELDETFSTPELADQTFELISCFYGLYYAQHPDNVLRSATKSLAPGGAIVVVGPYGDNNASLFALLENYLELPELVVRSSTSFMEQEVVPVLEERLAVRRETFVNRVRYPDPDAVMTYWRASTFFDAKHADAIESDVKKHFDDHDEFAVEKHVMAAIGIADA